MRVVFSTAVLSSFDEFHLDSYLTYDILSDPDRRARYDSQQGNERPDASPHVDEIDDWTVHTRGREAATYIWEESDTRTAEKAPPAHTGNRSILRRIPAYALVTFPLYFIGIMMWDIWTDFGPGIAATFNPFTGLPAWGETLLFVGIGFSCVVIAEHILNTERRVILYSPQ